ncbi:MAG: hypothetical protein JW929_14225 [Anaerolineales bacterium]|nr:hypothetical protein [Anaerolineales bacterium]
MTVDQAEVLGIGFLLFWLALETLWDLAKSTILPVWLVLPPVAAGVLYQAVFGEWYVAAAMAAALLLHLSNRLVVRGAGTVLLLSASLAAGNLALAAGLVLFWALWEMNIAGGADSLAAYAALMIAPRWEMFGFLLGGIFLWAAGTMIVVYRHELVARWKRMAWRVVLRNLPSEAELNSEGRPTIGGIWIGVLLFAVWRALA